MVILDKLTAYFLLLLPQAGGGGALNVLVERFNEGGPWMWPVLICLIIGLAISFERIISLNLADINTQAFLQRVKEALDDGGIPLDNNPAENAIRPFVGEGVLVWGARTLDGNSLDWRYISVRRTMIMLEESIRLAAKAYVFEPNTANTWVTMRSMIENFLGGIWKQGGLAGAVPTEAFSVHVGLGETMTPEDILEGILRITVLVAVSRPAEFIEITFQQQMQRS